MNLKKSRACAPRHDIHRTTARARVSRGPIAIPSVLVPLVAALAALPGAAAETPPTAGSLLKQTQPVRPPEAASGDTGLKVEDGTASGLPASAPFRVNRIVLSGNRRYDNATLHALVADAEGRELTLQQLEERVARITAYYRQHGYALARAIIPAQSVRDGVVNVQVIEAHYGHVELHNRSRAGDRTLAPILAGLRSGEDVRQDDYEHVLLMLSDVPGVKLSAVLKPGADVGTTDLQVEATDAQRVTGSATLDNYGNHATGRARLTGTVSINEPLHLGDIASAGIVTTGPDMNYGTLSYEALAVPAGGTRVGTSFTALRYKLGDGLSALGGHGTAAVASLWLRQTLWRQREANVFIRVQYDHQNLRDDLDSTNIRTDRHIDSGTLTLNGDLGNHALAGGVSAWMLALTSGKPRFDNAQAALADAATARTQSEFLKLTFGLAHWQALDARDQLFVNLYGQHTNRNLDASQKMEAGGPFSVRAYDVGVLSGDQGELGSLELRRHLGAWRGGAVQAVAFYDWEHLTINKSPWLATTNAATLQGAGAGLAWSDPAGWSARAYAAAPVGATPALAGTRPSWHGWAEVSRSF